MRWVDAVVTIDLRAIRRNAARLSSALAGAELWAVVKADGYGHGAVDVGRAALGAGATALCVATVPEALALRVALGPARILVLGPTAGSELEDARAAGLELVVGDGAIPEGVPVHLKLDTGMGRWGLSELPAPTRDVVGLMSHFASADCDPAFTETQIERFRRATDGLSHLTRHLANSAGVLRYPAAAFDAGRCGIALYGISPFGTAPGERRARAGPPLGVRAGADEAAAARRIDRLRAPVRRGRADLDRDRPSWLRGRLPPRPQRNRDPRGGRALHASSAPSRWMPSPSSSGGSFPSGHR